MEKKLEVRKANALVEASYRLSLNEHRLLLACLAQVRRNETITDQTTYTVRALDISSNSDVSRHHAYRDLKAAADRLLMRLVSVPTGPDGRPPAMRKFHWIQEAIYRDQEGVVDVRFSNPILPYISELAGRYTVYAMADVAKMTSSHGIRLYELLMQWVNTKKTREVDVDWLRAVFQLEGKYKAIKDLKKYVIEPAIQQINDHSPLWVEYEQRKKGRKVTHFVFTYGSKEPEKPKAVPKQGPAPKKPSGGLPEALVRKYMAEGDTYEQGEAKARAHLDAIRGS